ncbi:hypothetical protein [uncultured Methanospirillum sp.]|uniref:hypothetical protein n=1 Tax=uncultured Methanospirillum sp. TaxID=262503 RepID=UPI0029C86109|nr:hypothetical protein [uncultured Methanospirillum sp.]
MDPVEDLIIHSLYGQKRALMIKEIAQYCGLDRHTVSRRLDCMEILGQVRKLELGNSKRYYLNNTLSTYNLVDICSDLILVINDKWRVQYINKSAQELCNLLDKPVIGERVDDLKLELFSSPPVIEGLKKFDPLKISKIRLSYNFKETERFYEVSIMSIPFRPGFTSTVIIAVDSTEKEKLKKDLLTSEERFRLLFEFAPIAINEEDWSKVKEYIDNLTINGVSDLNQFFIQNPDQLKECICCIQILKTNTLSRKYFKQAFDSPISIKDDLIPYLSIESYDALRMAILSIYNEKPSHRYEIYVNNPRGKSLYFLIQSQIIQNDVSDMSKVFTVFQDITDFKLLQAELVQKQDIMFTILEELIHENYMLKEKFNFFH